MNQKLFVFTHLVVIPEFRKALRSLAFLNIRDPGRCLNQKFSGSRILRNPIPTLTLREGFLNSGMTLEGSGLI